MSWMDCRVCRCDHVVNLHNSAHISRRGKQNDSNKRSRKNHRAVRDDVADDSALPSSGLQEGLPFSIGFEWDGNLETHGLAKYCLGPGWKGVPGALDSNEDLIPAGSLDIL